MKPIIQLDFSLLGIDLITVFTSFEGIWKSFDGTTFIIAPWSLN